MSKSEKAGKQIKKQFTVVYQDKHCRNSLAFKVFKTEGEAEKFLSSGVCPEGERMQYAIVAGEFTITPGYVDET
jgi:hypothetical protein